MAPIALPDPQSSSPLRSHATTPPAVRHVVLAVVLFAGVAVGLFSRTRPGDLSHPWLLLLIVILVAVEGATAVKIARGRGNSTSEGGEDALFVFLAVAFSPIDVLVVVVAGAVVGNLVARRAPIKSVFNIANFAAAAALALMGMDLIAPSSEVGVRRVVAVLVAGVIFSGLTRLAVSGVIAATLRSSVVEQFVEDFRSAVVLFAGDVSLGLLAGLAAFSHSWTIPFAFAAMLTLNFAYSGHARARQQSQMLDDLVVSSSDGIFSVDGDGLIQLWNPAMSRLSGRSAGEVMDLSAGDVLDLCDVDGQRATGYLAPEDADSDRSDVRVLQAQDRASGRWLRVSRSPLAEKGYSFIVRDVTPEHEAAEAIATNEERLRLALSAGSMGWWERDTTTDTEVWSESLEAMLGLGPGEFSGRYQDFVASVHPDDRDAVVEAADRALEEGDFAMTYRVLWPDGTDRWIEGSGRLIQTKTGPKMLGVSRDVTERKTMEANLLHAQKIEAVGQLAAGIAHDFRNMLTVVNGYSELILNRLDPDDPLREKVQQIAAAGGRAALLSAQLLTFSHKQAAEPGALDLNQVVLGIRELLPTILPFGVELVVTADGDLGKIRGDIGELEQAVMNLAINAGHAMPNGGRLTLEITNIEIDEAAATEAGIAAGPCIRLAVGDTGVGMDEATRRRIFEPFFTTKNRGEGTGLGLATVIAIVEQCRGAISVASAPGAGTTFEILFPRLDAAPSTAA